MVPQRGALPPALCVSHIGTGHSCFASHPVSRSHAWESRKEQPNLDETPGSWLCPGPSLDVVAI